MKVALGTIEVDDDERRLLAAWYGERGLASRRTVRRWALTTIASAWQDIGTDEND